MMTIFAVVLGAGIGSVNRTSVERQLHHRVHMIHFPVAIFVINSIGSLFGGIVLATTDGNMRLFLLTGLAGSLTTFSGWAHAISFEFYRKKRAGTTMASLWVVGAVLLSLVTAMVLAWVGWMIGS